MSAFLFISIRAGFISWPFFVLLLFTACSSQYLSVEQRIDYAQQLAGSHGFEKKVIDTGDLTLLGFASKNHQSRVLDIYIEGDGFSWVSRNQVSRDPTPINPLALKLAVQNLSNTTVYLARPCQFLLEQNRPVCHSAMWTTARFSEAVVVANNQAIDQLKTNYSADKIRLFGFSGGGAVAALIAARRDDVELLVTVAGNLNPVFWAKYHGFSPLSDSLNPADYVSDLQNIKQFHVVGAEDSNVVPEVAESYMSGLLDKSNIQVLSIDGADHSCCWVEQWPALLRRINHF